MRLAYEKRILELPKDSIEPIEASPLPAEVNALIIKHVYHHETFIKVLKTKNVDLVKAIIADDPQCGGVSYEQVSAIFDEIYEKNKHALDYYWKN